MTGIPGLMTAQLRDEFLLRRDVAFLNHGSFGATPRPVLDAYRHWQEELERQPVEFLARRSRVLLLAAREALAEYVGASADEVVYVPNATTAANIIARALPLGPGDEVLATDHEYGAMDRLWRLICEERGARYVRAAVAVPVSSADEIVEAIWAQVTPRTRVLFWSHLTAPTALRFPVEPLVHRAREAGLLTVVDGAHAPGQIPVNLGRLGMDCYVANCHKWMCAPKGAGFLYVRRDRQVLIKPLIVSWGPEWSEYQTPSRFITELEWQGTRDLAAFLAVPAAIEFLRAHGWDTVRASCHALAQRVREEITALTGLPPLSPDRPEWYAQMISLPFPVADAVATQRRLLDDAGVEVPVMSWNGRILLRVSIQGYNTAQDVDALLDGVRAVLPAANQRAAAP